MRDGAAPPGGARSGQLELRGSSRGRQRGSGGAYGRGPDRHPPWRGSRGAGGIRWSGRSGQGAGCGWGASPAGARREVVEDAMDDTRLDDEGDHAHDGSAAGAEASSRRRAASGTSGPAATPSSSLSASATASSPRPPRPPRVSSPTRASTFSWGTPDDRPASRANQTFLDRRPGLVRRPPRVGAGPGR